MSGDSAVRTLLEKMTQCASTPYLRILERLENCFHVAKNWVSLSICLLFFLFGRFQVKLFTCYHVAF